MMKLKDARAVAGSLGYPSKMPGTSYGISASMCGIGAKLAQVDGSVCFDCYALKGNYVRSSVKKAHAKRLAGIRNPLWVAAMVTLLQHAHGPKGKRKHNGRKLAKGWHRFHDSGDLQSVEHLTKIAAVAAMTPAIRHWLPTRELGMVQAYVRAGGIVPDNLTIRVSATMVDGPATSAWPITSTVHSRTVNHFSSLNDAPMPPANVCPAPKQEGKCKACRMCWDKAIAQTSYHLH